MPRTGCGLLISLMCVPVRGLCIPRLSPMYSPARLSAGHYQIHCVREVLPLQALNQAITSARETTRLIHHADHGTQYISIIYHQRLDTSEMTASTQQRPKDSYDNALAENINGSYKNELINARRWFDAVEVEIATFQWVNWWNETRLHKNLDYRTPIEVETEYWNTNHQQDIMENKANA